MNYNEVRDGYPPRHSLENSRIEDLVDGEPAAEARYKMRDALLANRAQNFEEYRPRHAA